LPDCEQWDVLCAEDKQKQNQPIATGWPAQPVTAAALYRLPCLFDRPTKVLGPFTIKNYF